MTAIDQIALDLFRLSNLVPGLDMLSITSQVRSRRGRGWAIGCYANGAREILLVWCLTESPGGE
jgi:hypothetical protein